MFNKKTDSNSYFANEQAQNGDTATELTTSNVPIDISGLGSETAPKSNSIIDEMLKMKGDLESDGDILIQGKVTGNVRCRLLVVDKGATIDGGISAEEVIIRGITNGKIQANRVRLEETAHVSSEIFHRSFAVHEGARIEGALYYRENPLDEGDKPKTTAAKAEKTVKPAAEKDPAPLAKPAAAATSATNGSASTQ